MHFYYEGKFNETALLYLTILSAIQALNILKNHMLIDDSSIIVTRGSFGGLHTMYLAGIRGDQIKGAISMGALGDIKSMRCDPSKLLFYVFNKTQDQIPDSYWQKDDYDGFIAVFLRCFSRFIFIIFSFCHIIRRLLSDIYNTFSLILLRIVFLSKYPISKCRLSMTIFKFSIKESAKYSNEKVKLRLIL